MRAGARRAEARPSSAGEARITGIVVGSVRRATRAASAVAVALAAGCVQDPPFYDFDAPRVLHLSGTPYERGVAHGERYGDEIRQVYTEFLSNALLPYFDRDQPDVAAVLPYYGQERFTEDFTFQFLLEAGQGLEPFIPERFREELRGIADGSGVSYEQILVLNTIFDSILSLLNIQVLLRQVEAPVIREIAFPATLSRDGVDNDEDGVVDEEGEHLFGFPLRGSEDAVLRGVPDGATIRITFDDRSLANLFDGDGINLDTVRIRFDSVLYTRNEEPRFRDNGDPFDAVIEVDAPATGPGPVTFDVEVADLDEDDVPPPAKPNVARLERLTYLVDQADQPLAAAPNVRDPTAIGNNQAWTFAAQGSMTTDGATVVGRAMALLDIDVLHNFVRTFVYHPEDGGPSYAVIGYTGIAWALSGMSERGIVGAINRCETMNDSTIGNVFASEPYRLAPTGQLGPWLVREVLESANDLDEAEDIVRRRPPATGWNLMFVDGPRDDLRVFEIDANLERGADGGFTRVTPSDGVSSVSDADDLRHSTHWVENVEDGPPGVDLPLPFPLSLLFKLPLPDQALWAGTYFSSVNTFARLGAALDAGRGRIDVEWTRALMLDPQFYDELISMHNAIFLPDSLEMYVAAGTLPAIESEFNRFGPELFEEPAR